MLRRVQLQKIDPREGFGLVVSVALRKKPPVIGDRVNGIALQIEEGTNRCLVNESEKTAERVIRICHHPNLAGRMSRRRPWPWRQSYHYETDKYFESSCCFEGIGGASHDPI